MKIKGLCKNNMIKLSVSRGSYAIIRDGQLLDGKSYSSNDSRQDTLRNLHRGLISVKGYLTVDDLLTIELADGRVANWLEDLDSNSNYVDLFYNVYVALNSLPCEVSFAKVKSLSADNLTFERPYVPVSNFEM